MKKILLVFLITFNKINACICVPPSIEKEFNYSSHVFIGKIIDIKKYDKIYLLGESNKSQYIFIEIIRDFKGFQNRTKYITLLNHQDSCSREFLVGKKYIFYCNSMMGSELLFAPNVCSRTISENSNTFKNEVNTLSRFKNPDENNHSKGYRTIEEEELNSLRQDHIKYKEKEKELLKKENQNLVLIIICISLLTTLILYITRKRFK